MCNKIHVINFHSECSRVCCPKKPRQNFLVPYLFISIHDTISLVCLSFIEMYLRPPFASEEMKIDDWIKVRQSGIRYYMSLGDQRIVDKYFIIHPKAEFEVGQTTLGGLLALGYNVVVSFKRMCTSVYREQLLVVAETIDTLNETFLVLKGPSRTVCIISC
jgi:hypothetical protein